ncbi:FkbM family methyltransferase [bacterium]|nr:FkbM family methyltransferase [bacterium]
MRALSKTLAFALLDLRRTRGFHLMRDLRYWLKSIPSDGVVLDVGANKGDYALEFRRYLRRPVYAFEPVGKTYAQLQAATRHDSGIVCFPLAMGEKPGSAEIAINPSTTLVSSLRPNARWHADAIRETVIVSTVDAFVQEHNVRRIAVLKVDVEGYELEVLTGASQSLHQRNVDFIVLETAFLSEANQHRVTVNHLLSHLGPLGYEPWGVYDCEPVEGDRGGIGFMNVVFGRGRNR